MNIQSNGEINLGWGWQITLARILPHIEIGDRIDVDLFSKHAPQLMDKNPFQGVLQILMHHGGGRTDHPAMLWTFLHHSSYLLDIN